MRFLAVLFLALTLFFSKAEAELIPEDFSCGGITLGESVSEKALAGAFGSPLFDNDRNVFGVRVKYFTFKNNIVVGVIPADGTVADIKIADEKYVARDDLRYGATAHKITKVYGKTEKRMIDGVIYYFYENPENTHERLLIETDSTLGSLVSWRMTNLPLNVEEARDGEDWHSNELGAFLSGKEIDMSALNKKDGT